MAFPQGKRAFGAFFRQRRQPGSGRADYLSVAPLAGFSGCAGRLFTKISPSWLCTERPPDLPNSRGPCLWIEMGIAIIQEPASGVFTARIRQPESYWRQPAGGSLVVGTLLEFAVEKTISSFPQGSHEILRLSQMDDGAPGPALAR